MEVRAGSHERRWGAAPRTSVTGSGTPSDHWAALLASRGALGRLSDVRMVIGRQVVFTNRQARSMYKSGGHNRSGHISVCMATYNGATFVRQQLASILDQLGPSDEVIVADDASTDDTASLVSAFGDSRITLLRGERNQGHVRTFERAISAAAGESIFLADQDDLWAEGRVQSMLGSLDRGSVVAGNLALFGTCVGAPRQRLLATHSGAGLRNILGIFFGKRPYFGSAMAFRRELLPILLPIPDYVEAHDLWLATVGNLVGGVEHREEPVVLRRMHGNNLTPDGRRSLDKVLLARALMLRAVLEIVRRRSRAGRC